MDSTVVLAITVLSVKVALLATIVVMPVAVGLGWWFANQAFRGKILLETIVMLPMFLPPVATGLVLLHLLSGDGAMGPLWALMGFDGLLLTWQAEVVVAGVMGIPFFIRSSHQAFAQVPSRLEKMGATYGIGPWMVFWKISLPLAARGIGYGFALCFARAMGEFGATSLVAGIIPGKTETLALGIYARIISSNDREAWILCAVSAAIVVLILLLAELWMRPKAQER